MIEIQDKIPHHKKLYEILRRHIVDGLYPEGSLLPSENELCSIHNVTRPTVRQALSRLVHEGYIIKHQGKGSIVKAVPKGIGILSIQGTTTSIGKHNLQTIPTEKPYLASWPRPFLFELSDKEQESGCIILERRRIVDDKPILYDISYIPNINIPRFTKKSFANRSLFDVFRRFYQIEIRGGQQKIRALKANAHVATYLDLKVGEPVLQLERRMDTNRPGFSFYSLIYCNTNEFFLEGTF